MKIIHLSLPLIALLICSRLAAADVFDDDWYRNRYRGQSAVVFWNGVNGCNPSPNPQYEYEWEVNASSLRSILETEPGDIGEPFGILSRRNQSPEQVAKDLDDYLARCQSTGKRPFIVMSPHLDIKGYFATLNPFKLNPFTIFGEMAVGHDKKWTREVTPVILEKLSSAGYKISGYAHSWGGTMATEGIRAGRYKIDSLTMMNARVPMSSLETLNGSSLVGSLRRITTYQDAPALARRAANPSGDIHIIDAEMPDWGSILRRHSFFVADKSTSFTVEVGGRVMKADLGSVLNGDVLQGRDLNAGDKGGIDIRIHIDPDFLLPDESGALKETREEILETRPDEDSLYWPTGEEDN